MDQRVAIFSKMFLTFHLVESKKSFGSVTLLTLQGTSTLTFIASGQNRVTRARILKEKFNMGTARVSDNPIIIRSGII